MTRSRRHTPIIGFTRADSEKAFKQAEHRRERRSAKQAEDIETFDGDYGNPWAGDKDGKRPFDPARHPKLMRK